MTRRPRGTLSQTTNELDRTRDHLIPKSRGGGNATTGNVVFCHYKCNNEKGSMTVEEYRMVIAASVGIAAERFVFYGESEGKYEPYDRPRRTRRASEAKRTWPERRTTRGPERNFV